MFRPDTRNLGLLPLLLGGWLTACAPLPEREGATPAGEVVGEAIVEPAVEAEPIDEAGVYEPLTPELMFNLLTAEIAGRREVYDLAVEGYLNAAQLSRDPRVAQRATRTALYAGAEAAAKQAASRWVELSPDNLDARRLLALLALRSGDEATALANLEALTTQADDPERAGRELDLSSTQFANEEQQRLALKVLGELARKYPENPLLHYAHATLALANGEAEQALAAVDEALRLRPEWGDARQLRGKVLLKRGEVEAGLAELAAVVEAHPADERYRLGYARALLMSERQEAALEQFKILHEAFPGNSDVAFAYGLLLIDAEQLEPATAVFTRLIEQRQRLHDAHYFLGRIAEIGGDYTSAINHYQMVVAGERHYDSQLRIVRLWARSGELERARAHLQQLRERAPELAGDLYEVEASLLQEAGRLDESFAVYGQALALDPENSDLLYGHALAAERIGRIDILEQNLRKVLQREPENARALNALGYTLIDRTERIEEGGGYVERAYQLQPDEPAILDSMGWLHYRRGDHARAIEFLRKALDTLQDGEIAAHLGELLWVTGERDEAREVWEHARKLEPEHRILKRVMEQFLK